MPKLAQGVYGKTVQKKWFLNYSRFVRKWPGCNLAAFSLPQFFLSPSFIGFFFFYNRCPTFSLTLHPPFFRVVVASHGILTATLWANVGSRISHNGSGKSATTAILWDRIPAFWRIGAGSVYVLVGTLPWPVPVSGWLVFISRSAHTIWPR